VYSPDVATQRAGNDIPSSVGFALLAFVAGGARHGYELKQRWDEVLGASRPLQFGQIYATLARLERDGLLELDRTEVGHGPERKCYAITPEGRAALEAWLGAPVPADPTLGGPFLVKLMLAAYADKDIRELLDAQRAVHLAEMRKLTRRKVGADRATAWLLDHALFHLEADLRFVDHVVASINDRAQEVQE
jgi:DNA-binding PadR family transcriptional regulator